MAEVTMDPRWVWSWSGRCFGYWEGDDLWTVSGRHVGRRDGADVFSSAGHYVGELMGNGRLITNKAKAANTGPSFVPRTAREPRLAPRDSGALIIYRGHQDFPDYDDF